MSSPAVLPHGAAPAQARTRLLAGPWAPLVAWWRARSVLARDGILAVVMCSLALVPGAESNGVMLGGVATRPLDGLGVLLVLGQGLPLVLRRRAPAVALGLVGLSLGFSQVLGYAPFPTSFALPIALFSAGAHQRRWRREVALLATLGYVYLALVVHAATAPSTGLPLTSSLLGSVWGAALWVIGAWMRARAAEEVAHRRRQAREAALQAREAVVQERARIARELHDVVTHHVTAMVVQADAAAVAPGSPEPTTAALERIATSGRQAMVELRHQLGALQEIGPDGRADDDGGRAPVPGRLRDLVDQATAAGQSVQLREEGDLSEIGEGLGDRCGEGVQLAVYRIVQESLTNARKHAPGAVTDVLVRYAPAGVDIKVCTESCPTGAGRPWGTSAVVPGRGPAPGPWQGSGRGLIGMRERAASVGGRLEAGPVVGGGFRVAASIPATGSRG